MKGSFPPEGQKVETVRCTATHLIVELMDGRTISAPLCWYPRLFNATPEQREKWEICGGGFGIHWPDVDEHLSVAGILSGHKAPGGVDYTPAEVDVPVEVPAQYVESGEFV